MPGGAIQQKVIAWGLLYALCLFVSFYFEFFFLTLIPLLGMVVIMTIFRMHWTFYLIAFVTPLSIDLSELDMDGIGLIIPTFTPQARYNQDTLCNSASGQNLCLAFDENIYYNLNY